MKDFTTPEYIAPIIEEIKTEYSPEYSPAALSALDCIVILNKKRSRNSLAIRTPDKGGFHYSSPATRKVYKALADYAAVSAEAGRDPNKAAPAEVFTDPNKTEAAAQYNKYTEEEKTIAANVPDSVVKECIDKINTSFQFVYLQDVYRHYVQRCIAKNTTPIFQKYFLVAANRAGYPTYNYYSKKCLWISDKPKSKPGKRKRQPRK